MRSRFGFILESLSTTLVTSTRMYALQWSAYRAGSVAIDYGQGLLSRTSSRLPLPDRKWPGHGLRYGCGLSPHPLRRGLWRTRHSKWFICLSNVAVEGKFAQTTQRVAFCIPRRAG
ncbi:hypothetical protein BKA70DRAFT_719854 [Coprinopsis sp. MPI-PUGE-AT-0042]|nr:hypothetical protein BKA70DRAFT_719854 [Coprinopsis sp. MPI-PUGE-AT-0042]